jgi:hypothetical protein
VMRMSSTRRLSMRGVKGRATAPGPVPGGRGTEPLKQGAWTAA